MDTYENHPSQSILDAAYPDAPYRPGQGQQSTTALPSHSPSENDFVYAPQSPSAPSWQRTPSSTTTNYGPNGVPDVPPPPYAPSPTSHQRPAGQAQQDIPLQTLSPTSAPSPPLPAHLWTGNSGDAYNSNSHAGPSNFMAIRPYGYVEPTGSGGSTMSGKTGPLAALRRRKRLRLCLVFLSLAILVMLSLIIGVAVGVIKENGDGNDDDNPPPPPGFP